MTTTAVSNATEQAMAAHRGDVHGDLTVAKVLAMIVLGQGCFLLGAVPLKLTKRWSTEPLPSSSSGGGGRRGRRPHKVGSRAASLLLCFGGGVLLCTTMLHLQPAARQSADAARRDGRLPDVEHAGDLLFCAGFFAAFLVDELAHACARRLAAGGGAVDDVLRRALSARRRSVLVTRAAEVPEEKEEEEEFEEKEAEEGDAERRRGEEDRLWRGVFAVLALSFHGVFEGMAIGLEDRADHAWYLLLAVATRKLVVACVVGLELAWSVAGRSALVAYVAAFAAVTPVGVALGMTVAHHVGGGFEPGPAAVALQCLTAGTLLYVVFLEVLPVRRRFGWSHLLSVAVGFGVLSTL